MANVEDQITDMDQHRIDELQNQYFRAKLATIDAKRVQQARESLERSGRSSSESAERARADATVPNRPRQEDQRARVG